jgi:hypothetical protein
VSLCVGSVQVLGSSSGSSSRTDAIRWSPSSEGLDLRRLHAGDDFAHRDSLERHRKNPSTECHDIMVMTGLRKNTPFENRMEHCLKACY